jgi:prepilin-type N-terminal cleavage/methylation domain-containing protein/prepilin-type processing-associated H-X9-DG protein
MKSRSFARQAPGFTLVELLVVIAIIGILVGLILPAVNGARESGRRLQCQNNMRNVALATLQYENQFKKFPPARTLNSKGKLELHGFFIHILNNLEEKTITDRYDMKKAWNDPANLPATSIAIPAFVCPSVGEDRGPIVDFAPLLGVRGTVYDSIRKGQQRHPSQPRRMTPTLGYEPGIILDLDSRRVANLKPDGMSNTVMFVECGGRPQHFVGGVPRGNGGEGRWADPQSYVMVDASSATPRFPPPDEKAAPGMMNFVNAHPNFGSEIYSFHSGGANMAFGDGTVRFIADTASDDALISLFTAQDGDLIDSTVLAP